MIFINKQDFLAELGKLLTFMYDEDRQTVLAMYSRIFDEVSDEQALVHQLMSPTRQAVLIARAYNAKAGRLAVESERRGKTNSAQEKPRYIAVIEDIEAEALAREAAAGHHQLSGQRSLFEQYPEDEDEAEEQESASATEPDFYTSLTDIASSIPVQETAVPAVPVNEEAEAAAAGLSILDYLTENAAQILSGDAETPAVSQPDQAAEDAAVQPVEEQAEEREDDSLPEEANDSAEESATPLQKETAAVASLLNEIGDQPEVGKTVRQPKGRPKLKVRTRPADDPYEEDEYETDVTRTKLVRKTNVPLAVLFTIVAIPVCLLLIGLLLIPTLLSAGLAAISVCSGAMLLSAAFSGFAVFADILVVLGCSLVLLAVGLLLIWIFVWLIAAGMVGVVQGAVQLGKRFCTKEKEVAP